jgi:AraC family ethanolamine operon transcriptional activator
MTTSLALPQPTLVTCHVADIDEFAAMMNATGREANIDPLRLGPFCADVWLADFGTLHVSFCQFGGPMHHTGVKRQQFLHFDTLLAVGPGPNRIHGHEVGSQQLFSFDPQRASDTILSAGTLIGDVLVSQDVFFATCQAMRRDDLDSKFLRGDIVYLPRSLSTYQQYLREILQLIQQRSPLLSQPDYRHMLLGDLVPLLIDAIPRQKPRPLPAALLHHRAQLARRARDYIHAHLDQPLTLKDIYTEIGTSRRTLYYSFETIFGMTPMDYVKVQRLRGVRRSLKQADPKATSITKIANQWGFWSLYHFAKAYQAQFGELPSETLRKL